MTLPGPGSPVPVRISQYERGSGRGLRKRCPRFDPKLVWSAQRPAVAGNGDLSRMTIREAILTVLTEAKPVSVDLTDLKQAGEVINPSWGFWTVP